MFANTMWSAWGFFSGSAFRLGMWFVRLSSYRLTRSSGRGYTDRWSITHWSDDKIPLNKENYTKYSEFILTLLWFAAEPHPDHAGCVPLHQHAFIVQLVSSHWSGGCAAATVALIDEVMAANDLVSY